MASTTTTTTTTTTNAGLPTDPGRDKYKIAVVGAGSFGTAMAQVAAHNDHDVWIYARDPEQVRAMQETHKNPKYLSEFELSSKIHASCNLTECLEDAEMCLLCIPAQKTPHFIQQHREEFPSNCILVNTSKGLYVPTQQLLSEAIDDALMGNDNSEDDDGNNNNNRTSKRGIQLAFLSGPSFAKEIMQSMPTAVVVASRMLYTAVKVQRALSSTTFRIYSSQDVIGVQLGGSLKNPLAIGAGMIEGSGYGINSLAAFVTRSCNELRQLCVAMGGQPDTVSGLSGVGDLMLTCFGSLSRNRSLGVRIMKGEVVEDILKEYTVEGVPTASVAVAYADRCGLEVPNFRAVQKVLSGEIDPKDVEMLLMSRPLRSEY